MAELIACSIGEAGKGKAMRQKCRWQKWAGRRRKRDGGEKVGAGGDARASSTCCRVVCFGMEGIRIGIWRRNWQIFVHIVDSDWQQAEIGKNMQKEAETGKGQKDRP